MERNSVVFLLQHGCSKPLYLGLKVNYICMNVRCSSSLFFIKHGEVIVSLRSQSLGYDT